MGPSRRLARTILGKAYRSCRFGLLPPYTQRIGHPVDVIKPGRDQCDLQDASVLETCRPQLLVIIFPDAGGVFCEFHDVVEHYPLLRRDGSGGVVLLERLNQLFIQGHATQKLCVSADSINAPVGHRDHGGDHLVLPPAERQFR